MKRYVHILSLILCGMALYAVNAETGKIEWDYAVFSNLPAGAYPNINSAVAVNATPPAGA